MTHSIGQEYPGLMSNPWGYVDPVQQAREEQMYRRFMQPQSGIPGTYVQPVATFQLQPVQSPLAGLDQAVPQIFAGAGYPRYENTAERMLVAGLFGALLGKMFADRRARKAQRLQELKDSLGISDVE